MLYQIVSFRMSIDELIYFALLTPIPRNPSFQTYIYSAKGRTSDQHVQLLYKASLELSNQPRPRYSYRTYHFPSSIVRTQKCLFFGKFYVCTEWMIPSALCITTFWGSKNSAIICLKLTSLFFCNKEKSKNTKINEN